MADALALVSRGAFEELERSHGAIGVGTVVPIDR